MRVGSGYTAHRQRIASGQKSCAYHARCRRDPQPADVPGPDTDRM